MLYNDIPNELTRAAIVATLQRRLTWIDAELAARRCADTAHLLHYWEGRRRETLAALIAFEDSPH